MELNKPLTQEQIEAIQNMKYVLENICYGKFKEETYDQAINRMIDQSKEALEAWKKGNE